MTPRVQVLHRLDANTSGVMLFAKDSAAVAPVHAQFRQRTVRKAYLAVALACPSTTHFSCSAPLAEHATVPTAACVCALRGKASSTEMEVVSVNGGAVHVDALCGTAWVQPSDQRMSGACLVHCKPLTGARC